MKCCWVTFTALFSLSISYCLSAAAAKSLQSFPTLCDPIDGSLPGSPIPGILQARTLEWVAISFPNAWKWKVKVKSLSRVQFLATPWTAAYQAPPSMEFYRQEHCLSRFHEIATNSTARKHNSQQRHLSFWWEIWKYNCSFWWDLWIFHLAKLLEVCLLPLEGVHFTMSFNYGDRKCFLLKITCNSY